MPQALLLAILCWMSSPSWVAQDDPPALIEKLRSDKAEEREAAERKLKDLGKAALPDLEKAARSSDREVAERARLLLRIIPVRLKLSSNLLSRRPRVDERLASDDPHAWTKELLEIADQVAAEEDPHEKDGDLSKKEVNPRIVKMWKETEKGKGLPLKAEDVRMLVVPAIRGAKEPDERSEVFKFIDYKNLHSLVPDLIAFLKEGDPNLRRNSIETLTRLRAASAVPAIKLALDDSNAGVRTSATQALSILGNSAVVQDLIARLDDGSADVREAAVFALSLRGAMEGVPGVARLLADSEPRVRAAAALSLGGFGSSDAVPSLIQSLKDQNPQVRGYAVASLGTLKAKEAASSVAKLQSDPDSLVRRNCIFALSRIKGKEAIADLEQALGDDDAQVQLFALQELSGLEARKAIPSIRKTLTSEVGAVRGTAAEILCQWGVREAVPVLLADSPYLHLLNPVRRPEVWKRLIEKKYTRERMGSRKKLVEGIAEDAGMVVQWPKDEQGRDVAWVSAECTIGGDRETHLGVLYSALGGERYEFVLEDRQIRILTGDEALAFWKSWWAEEEKK